MSDNLTTTPSENSDTGLNNVYSDLGTGTAVIEALKEVLNPDIVDAATTLGHKINVVNAIDSALDSSDSFIATLTGIASGTVVGAIMPGPVPLKIIMASYADQIVTDKVKELLQTHQPDPKQIEG